MLCWGLSLTRLTLKILESFINLKKNHEFPRMHESLNINAFPKNDESRKINESSKFHESKRCSSRDSCIFRDV